METGEAAAAIDEQDNGFKLVLLTPELALASDHVQQEILRLEKELGDIQQKKIKEFEYSKKMIEVHT